MTSEVPKHENLIAALAAAQGEFPPVVKDRTATVKSEKGTYTYGYANLSDVLAAVRPVLSRHGIALIQHLEPNGHGLMLRTALRGYGETLESVTPISTAPTTPQVLGSALTYYRRYSLMALVGVAADDDDDDGAKAGERPPAPAPAAARAGVSRETPRIPPDDAWLEAARLKVENAEPDALRAWWNSEEQKRQRADLHKRRADFAEPLEALKRRVAERWWECSSLVIVPGQKDGKPDWQRWQGDMARAIDAAPSAEKLNRLLADNSQHLDALRAWAPKAGEALDAKISNRLFTLDAEAPIDLGGDEEAAP